MAKLAIEGDPRIMRVAVLMSPALKQDVEKVAAVQRSSMNRVILEAIEKHLEKHQGDIKRYNDFFGEE